MRYATTLAATVLLVALGGCAFEELDGEWAEDEGDAFVDPEEDLDVDIGSSEHEALVLNNGGILQNGGLVDKGNLPSLDLTAMNSIPFTDGVKVDSCSSTGVTCFKLHPNLGPMYTKYGNALFDALVWCGMRPAVKVKFPSGRVVQGTELGKWATRNGVNPWWTSPPDDITKKRVSACLAAKHNAAYSGISINIVHPGDTSKSKLYNEMTVAANLFKSNGRYVRMWPGGRQLGGNCEMWSPYATERSCSNPNDNVECNYVGQGYAVDQCVHSGVSWTNCVSNNGTTYTETMTVYLDGGRDCFGAGKCGGDDCIGKK